MISILSQQYIYPGYGVNLDNVQVCLYIERLMLHKHNIICSSFCYPPGLSDYYKSSLRRREWVISIVLILFQMDFPCTEGIKRCYLYKYTYMSEPVDTQVYKKTECIN